MTRIKRINEITINEGNGFQLNFTARCDSINYDFLGSWNINVITFENKFNVENTLKNSKEQKVEYDATIYVMPDDSVEIRSIDGTIHGVVEGLTGAEVRKKPGCLWCNYWKIEMTK